MVGNSEENKAEEVSINDIDVPSDTDAVFTIPNILSMIRIALIPLFMFFYWSDMESGRLWTLLIVVISGITDLVDGYIARHFHMVSDLGKALDPIADKLSQFTLLLCLVSGYWWMIFPLILLAVKELVSGSFGLFTLKKTGVIKGAVWHGKLTTAVLYATMLLHLIWKEIPVKASVILVSLSCFVMLISFGLYMARYFRILKESRAEKAGKTDIIKDRTTSTETKEKNR